MSEIGRRVAKLDGPDKATGRARYVQDLVLPGMLHGAIKRSEVPHGRIRRVDASRARALRGVHAILTAADVPKVLFGYVKDTPALKGETVRRIGDEIAAVAAVSEVIARQALDLIDVEIEPLPAVFDLEAGPVAKTYDYEHGSVADGFREADCVVDGTFRLPAQYHGCLGPAGVMAEWDARGRLTLTDPTQIPFLIQRDLAAALGISPTDVRIVQPTIAGGFGARLDLYPHEVIAALLARAAGRPVRILFDREEDFLTDPVRPRTIVRLRTGATQDGRIVAREADVVVDAGAYVSWGAVTPVVMMHTFGCMYDPPHAKYRARVVYTNTQPTGAFRGFGNPEILFAMESQMDELAREIGMDPAEIRLRNANRPDTVTKQGSRILSCGMSECIRAASERIGPKRPASAPHLRRGVGLACVFHVGGGARIYRSDGCGAIVKLDDHGFATVVVGATDLGQGMETMAAQIAAETLGLPVERVRVAAADSDVRLWDVGVHASRTTFIAGNAVRQAAEKVRLQLLREAARELGTDDLDVGGGFVFAKDDASRRIPHEKLARSLHFRESGSVLVGEAYFDPNSSMMDEKYHGNVSATYTFGAHAVEVEVDVETGRVQVLRLVAAHDVGRAVNPMYVEGQIEGGVMQGLGYALSEEVLLRDGRMANAGFLDYRMPGPRDMPRIEPVLIETHDPLGPYGAKGVGEPPLVPVAAAVANAIADATGVRLRELPMTPERVYRALIATDPLDSTRRHASRP